MPTFDARKYANIIPNVSYSGCDMVVSMEVPIQGNDKIMQVIGSLQTLTYSIYMEKRPIRALGNVNVKDYVMGPRTIAGTMVFSVFNKHFTSDVREQVKTKYGLENYKIIADEMPPFNVTVSFANEYGYTSRLALYGITILNEGQTMSINDIYTENTYQFFATDIDYLEDLGFRGMAPAPKEYPASPKPPEEDYILSPSEIHHGTVDKLVPLRKIAESMGAIVNWIHDDKQTIVLYKDRKTELWVNNPIAKIYTNNAPAKNEYIDDRDPTTVPVLINDVVMTPLSFVSKALGIEIVHLRSAAKAHGATVEWIPSEKKAVVKRHGIVVEVWEDRPEAKVNGTQIYIDPDRPNARPVVVDGQMYAPLEFIYRSLGI